MHKKLVVCLAAGCIAVATTAFTYSYHWMKVPTDYYAGHTHQNGGTLGAPAHSGGTDRYGCHNASVPYHCH